MHCNEHLARRWTQILAHSALPFALCLAANAQEDLSIQITDSEGAGLSGAIVAADFLWDGDLADHELIVTGEGGHASVTTPGAYDEIAISAYMPGFVTRTQSFEAGASSVTVALENGRQVVVGVATQALTPVEGASIIPLPAEDWLLEGTSAANGIFEYSQIPPDTEGFLVLHPDYARSVVEIDGGVAIALLHPGYTMHGSVRDAASGQSLEATITLQRATPEGQLETPEHPDQYTLQVNGGDYSQAHLSAGLFQLDVAADGYLPATVFVAMPEADVTQDVSLHRASTNGLALELHDEVGAAVEGAAVMAHEPLTNFVAMGVSDADGRVNFDSVPGVPMLVTIVREGFLDQTLNAVPGISEVLTLQRDPQWTPPGTVKIEATPGGGSNAEEFWVILHSEQETYRIGNMSSPVQGAPATADVRPGTYNLIVLAEGAAANGSITVTSGSTHSVSVALLDGRTVEGAVDVSAGAPVIAVLDGNVLLAETTADVDGTFSLASLPHDRDLYLRTSWPAGSTTWNLLAAVPVDEIPPGGAFSSVDPVQGSTGDVDLEFVLPDGEPAAEVQVRLSSAEGDGLLVVGAADGEGRFALDGLPSGSYSIDNGIFVDQTQYWWPVDDVVITAGTLTSHTYGASTVYDNGYSIGDEITLTEECACNWQKIGPTHVPTGFKVLHLVSTSDKFEKAWRSANGAAWHTSKGEISLRRGAWGGAFGLGYANAAATAAPTGRSTGGIKLADRCAACKPVITGSLTVDMSMRTDASGLVGALGHLRATAVTTVSVSGDLQKSFAPQRGASTACGLGNNAGNVQVGGVQVPLPGGNCHADHVPFAGSVGPKTVMKSTFQIICNATHQSKAVGYGLEGQGLGSRSIRHGLHHRVGQVHGQVQTRGRLPDGSEYADLVSHCGPWRARSALATRGRASLLRPRAAPILARGT